MGTAASPSIDADGGPAGSGGGPDGTSDTVEKVPGTDSPAPGGAVRVPGIDSAGPPGGGEEAPGMVSVAASAWWAARLALSRDPMARASLVGISLPQHAAPADGPPGDDPEAPTPFRPSSHRHPTPSRPLSSASTNAAGRLPVTFTVTRHARRAATAVTFTLALLVGACSSGGEAGTANRASSTEATSATSPGPSAEGTPTDPATSAEAPGTTSTPGPPQRRTVAFGGDLLTHMPLVDAAQRNGEAAGAAYDFDPMFAPLAPVIEEADLALCHLEVPLVGDGQQVTGYPSFHAPRELATSVARAGYDGCSTASNHSLDGGLPAIEATLGTFDLLGLGHVGTARSSAEAAVPRIYDLDGVQIAHLSYAYGFNGYVVPREAPWAVNPIDPARIEADARAARFAGAQLVVASVHWGSEYRSEPDDFQVDTARILDGIADIDLVIGHHAHVVQPIERVGDTWVVYGLGNQLSNQSQPERRDGLTVMVTVSGSDGGRWSVQGIEAVPTWVNLDTYEVLPVLPALARLDLDPDLRLDLEASLVRTMSTVNRRTPVAAQDP